MYRVIKISITIRKYSYGISPRVGHKIKYVFENERGERKVRVLHTEVDNCINVVNKIVGKPFVDKFLAIGLPPVVDTNECFMRIKYRLTYNQRG